MNNPAASGRSISYILPRDRSKITEYIVTEGEQRKTARTEI